MRSSPLVEGTYAVLYSNQKDVSQPSPREVLVSENRSTVFLFVLLKLMFHWDMLPVHSSSDLLKNYN